MRMGNFEGEGNTVHVLRRRGLLSNYFDYLLLLSSIVLIVIIIINIIFTIVNVLLSS